MMRKKVQRGYTMVLFLAFIAATLLAGFSLYDNGIVATERIRIQNTTDATAYSTMSVLTRDMNFIAYTNRGMVGNQVAIAQMIGLNSWVHLLDQTATNLDLIAKLTFAFPPVGAVVNSLTGVLKRATTVLKPLVDTTTKVATKATDILNIGLSRAQNVFHVATSDMAIATHTNIAKANDENVKVGLLSSGLAIASAAESWQEIVNRNNSTSTRSRNKDELKNFTEFAEVVNSSRDPFTANRSYDWLKKTTIFDVAGVSLKVEVVKKGGSDFIETDTGRREVQWQWTAMDTVSFWEHFKVSGFFGFEDNTELVPLGWGAAHALNKNTEDSKTFFDYEDYRKKEQETYYSNGVYTKSNRQKDKKHWGDGTWENKLSAYAGEAEDGRNNLANTVGINDFYSLKNDDKEDTGPSIVVMLTKARNKLRVQQTLDTENADYNRSTSMQIEEKGSVAGSALYGLAKAETYFSRPRDLWARADNMREFGNLYNPFWQTRLIDNNADEQLLAAGIQAIN